MFRDCSTHRAHVQFCRNIAIVFPRDLLTEEGQSHHTFLPLYANSRLLCVNANAFRQQTCNLACRSLPSPIATSTAFTGSLSALSHWDYISSHRLSERTHFFPKTARSCSECHPPLFCHLEDLDHRYGCTGCCCCCKIVMCIQLFGTVLS